MIAGDSHHLSFSRAIDAFDEAFGDDTEAATVHYIEYGYAEGRRDEPRGSSG